MHRNLDKYRFNNHNSRELIIIAIGRFSTIITITATTKNAHTNKQENTSNDDSTNAMEDGAAANVIRCSLDELSRLVTI